jgi:hypothetical protein
VGLLCSFHHSRVCCFVSSSMRLWGYKSEWMPLHTLTSSRISNHCLLIFFLMPEKREREKRDNVFWGLESGTSPSFPINGRTRLHPSKVTQEHLQNLVS